MRFNENVLEAMKALSFIEKQYSAFDKTFFAQGYNIGSQEVYDAAMNLYGSVGQFIQTLEDLDENLDPNKTKLPDLDKVFEGNPVTDYVSSVIDLATGAGKVESVKEAAQKLADYQKEVYGEKKEGFSCLEDFIDYILADIGVEQDQSGEVFKKELKEAIKILGNRPGYSKFIISSKKLGTLEGKLEVSGEDVRITIADKEYNYSTLPPAKSYDGFCNAYPEDEVADDEELFPYQSYCCPDCDCACEEDDGEDYEEIPLIDFIRDTDSVHAEEINANMDSIQEHLDKKVDFDDDDVELIRYYLSHLPQHSEDEVNMMKDSTVKVAYRQRQFIRNISGK